MPKHAIPVGANRAGNFLATTVRLAMTSNGNETPALVAAFLSMGFVAICHRKLRRLRFRFGLQRGERANCDRYRSKPQKNLAPRKRVFIIHVGSPKFSCEVPDELALQNLASPHLRNVPRSTRIALPSVSMSGATPADGLASRSLITSLTNERCVARRKLAAGSSECSDRCC